MAEQRDGVAAMANETEPGDKLLYLNPLNGAFEEHTVARVQSGSVVTREGGHLGSGDPVVGCPRGERTRPGAHPGGTRAAWPGCSLTRQRGRRRTGSRPT
jgi:hypothetical protein